MKISKQFHPFYILVILGTVCSSSASADIVINEIMQNPSSVSDGNGEWIELHNPDADPVDIDGWTLRDNDFDSHVISNSGPLIIPANGYLILGNNQDIATNGGVSVGYNYGSGWYLGNSADEVVLLDSSLTEIDRVEYDNGFTFPDPSGASMALSVPRLDNNVGASWCESTTPFGSGDRGTPGTANDCGQPPPGAVPMRIHQIQGSGSSVTAPGTPVIVNAVVVGDYQESSELRGFFVQEGRNDEDGNPATSEGIFVYCGTCPVEVAEGNAVEVIGVQEEFFGMSQIDTTADVGSVVVTDDSNLLLLGAVSPAVVDLPASGGTDEEQTFEHFEGMLVQFVDELTVTEYFELARYGQIVLSEGGRQRQFTDGNLPDAAGYAAHLEQIARSRIILDDLNNVQNMDPVYHPQPGGFSRDDYFRGGDTVSVLTGVMHWSWAGYGGTDAWRVRPQVTNPAVFNANNLRSDTPESVNGGLKVATINVLNYFTTIDATYSNDYGDCGPSGTLDCRGADSPAELQRQTDKVVAALTRIDADIVGLVEIENNEYASLEALVDALNAVMGAGAYDFIDTGFIGTDAIKVGLIYKPSAVTPAGDFAVLDSSVDPMFVDSKNRPVLIQTFEENHSGERFTVAVNHLKSKGSSCANIGDPDLLDGQGNCNLTRTDAARALVAYLSTDPTDSGDPDYLIMGDLNAYAMEDPISEIRSQGYVDLIDAITGNEAYSFVFDGQLGYLDHALASSTLAPQVSGVTAWHINADEVNLLDYNDGVRDIGERSYEAKPGSNPLYDPDPYRSSDHDPIIIGLDISPTVRDKQTCKGGGWQDVYREDNTPFKNQGDCIQYVNTGK